MTELKGTPDQNWRLCGESIARASKARGLNRGIGINTPGVAFVSDRLQERREMLCRLALYER